MRTVRTSRRRWWRRRAAAILAAVAGVLLTGAVPAGAAPAGAAPAATASGPGFYFAGTPAPATFQVLRAGDLAHGLVDDQVFGLSTTGSGLTRLPFPIHAWNQTYQNVVVSSNGNIQLGLPAAQASTSFLNECLPSRTFGHPAVLPYWDDLFFDATDSSLGVPDGIFVRTAGKAPHRTFLVSWQGRENHGESLPVLAQVLFREGSQAITYGYGTSGGGAATVGIQAKQQLTQTQINCNSGTVVVEASTAITFVHRNAL